MDRTYCNSIYIWKFHKFNKNDVIQELEHIHRKIALYETRILLNKDDNIHKSEALEKS